VFSERRYSDEEREALAVAFGDLLIRPARRVVELAAAGKLQLDGRTLPPFETNASTVRSLAAAHARRRAGLATSELAAAPPQDATEVLRRRLVNVADAGIAAIERKQKRSRGEVAFEVLRQAARAVREIAAIPGPNDPRPPAPGAQVNGRRDGGATRGGPGAAILAEIRSPSPVDAPPEPLRAAPEVPVDDPITPDVADDPAAPVEVRMRAMAARKGWNWPDAAVDDDSGTNFDDDPYPGPR
jgi:hypothetical protein